MQSSRTHPHLLALPMELRCQIFSTLFGYHVARLARGHDGTESLLGEPRSAQLLRVCKQVHAEAGPILYHNTRFTAALTSDPKAIWRIVGVRNGSMVKQIDMHVDRFEDCILYCCTPTYSADFELTNIQITFRRWWDSNLDAEDKLRRLQALFTMRVLREASLQAYPEITEQCRDNGEVYFDVSFGDYDVQARLS